MALVQDVAFAEKALQRYIGAASDAQRDAAYPAIWLHLDAALAAAKAEGKDTSHVDGIRARLGERAATPPVPPDESGIEAARAAFGWFRAQYPALQVSAADSVPNLGPSKTKKTIVYIIAGIIFVACAIGAVIARIGMRSH